MKLSVTARSYIPPIEHSVVHSLGSSSSVAERKDAVGDFSADAILLHMIPIE